MVVLPEDDLDLGPVEFPATTNYHWPNFDKNFTDGSAFELAQGPFQFGLAVKLDNSKKQARIFSIYLEREKLEAPSDFYRVLNVHMFRTEKSAGNFKTV